MYPGLSAPFRTKGADASSKEGMAYGRRNNGAVEAIVVGAALVVVGYFLYRRSGRDWNEDLQTARNWIDERTDDAQGVLERTEKASKDLLASAQDYGHQALGSAKGAYEAVRERAS